MVNLVVEWYDNVFLLKKEKFVMIIEEKLIKFFFDVMNWVKKWKRRKYCIECDGFLINFFFLLGIYGLRVLF